MDAPRAIKPPGGSASRWIPISVAGLLMASSLTLWGLSDWGSSQANGSEYQDKSLVVEVHDAGIETSVEDSKHAEPRFLKTVIAPRSKQLEHFPCVECHDNINVRKPTLPPHGRHRRMTFKHMREVVQCYMCHDSENLDKLHLITGESVSFDDSHDLCGQCHSEKKRDWDIGAHGKYVGGWRGVRYKFTCVDCHDAHKPGMGQMKAVPPPPFPRFGIPKEAHHDET